MGGLWRWPTRGAGVGMHGWSRALNETLTSRRRLTSAAGGATVTFEVPTPSGQEGRPMRKKLRQPARRPGLLLWSFLLFSLVLGARTAWAQYPAGPQVTKDGTVVVLQDYASLPLSSRRTRSYPPATDFSYPVRGATVLA